METLTISEFRERFGTATERRRELCARFEEWLAVAAGTGLLRRVWVYGSFVSAKLDPNDVDALVLTHSGYEIEELPAAIQPYFRQEVLRMAWELDIFIMPVGKSDPYIDDVRQVLARGRQGNGVMLEVEI